MKKNNFITLILYIVFEFTGIKVNAQATIANNNAGGAAYLGWANTVGVPLEIRHDGNNIMTFWTNTFNRMQIMNNGPAAGFIGIGHPPLYTVPQNQLHQAQWDNNDNYHQFTNEFTGNGTPNDGFKVGISYDATTINMRADIMQQENSPMKFWLGNNNAFSGTITFLERLNLINGLAGPAATTNVTKFSICYGNTVPAITNPLANLNIGEDPGDDISVLKLGNRDWMETGTYNRKNTTHFYLGLKDDGSGRASSVIAFGDRFTAGSADNLKFIFSSAVNASDGDLGAQNGLEIARMTPEGHMGIGVGWTAAITPKRRLDIIDNASSAGAGTSNPYRSSGPQLRLTHTADASPTNGKWTDFETTIGGYLKINPSNHYSGFNLPAINNPTNAVEVYATLANKSGLTLSRLNSSSPVAITTNGKLLTVDPFGEVVLADDIGGGNVISGCSASPDKLARFNSAGTTIQCSDIYNNASSATNRIGFFTITPQYKFHNEGDALFTTNVITAPINLYAATTPALMVSSNRDEALSILHNASSYSFKDMLKIYADEGSDVYPLLPLYHFRSHFANDGIGNVTFDHISTVGSDDVVTS